MNKETLLQPSFDKLTEKLDNTQEYEDWLLIQDYIDEIKLEIHNYKKALNEIREYCGDTSMTVAEYKGLLEIVDTALGGNNRTN